MSAGRDWFSAWLMLYHAAPPYERGRLVDEMTQFRERWERTTARLHETRGEK